MLKVDRKTGEVTFTVYSKFQHDSTPLDVGSMIIQQYDFAWSDEIRDFIIVESTKEDRQAYIDSFADDCGVYNVLKKYALTGDASLLNRGNAFYGDISDLPEDELNPGKLQAQSQSSLDKLNQLLGTNYSADELAAMSTDDLAALIQNVAGGNATETPKEEGK